jgi:ABC-2 type transport system ATP-binding protein
MTAAAMIQVRDLVKTYGDKNALGGVSFDARAGEILGLLGPNGAGKSTTMKILTTYLSATSGTVTVDGVDAQANPLAVRAMLGYLPESTPLYADMVVYDYLLWCGEMRGLARADVILRMREVAKVVGLENVMGQVIGTLSKGYKQRVGLAQAMLHNPKILILDEPTSGLDPNQIIEIRNLIRSLGQNHTLILSSHNLTEVRQICDRVVIIHQGKVVADGTLDELEGRVASRHHLIVGVQTTAQHTAEALQQLLAATPGAGTVTFSHTSQAPVPTAFFDVEAATDIRSALFERVQGSGLTLLELRRKSLDLEGIFQSLTQGA